MISFLLLSIRSWFFFPFFQNLSQILVSIQVVVIVPLWFDCYRTSLQLLWRDHCHHLSFKAISHFVLDANFCILWHTFFFLFSFSLFHTSIQSIISTMCFTEALLLAYLSNKVSKQHMSFFFFNSVVRPILGFWIRFKKKN